MPRVVVKPVLRKKPSWGASLFTQAASGVFRGPAARALLEREAAGKNHRFATSQRKAPNSQHSAQGRIKPGKMVHAQGLPKWTPHSKDK
ncbi:Uncharacterised protein [uncultured archaeon]|nr:Uncharacterised protein [uncultured archaeon]